MQVSGSYAVSFQKHSNTKWQTNVHVLDKEICAVWDGLKKTLDNIEAAGKELQWQKIQRSSPESLLISAKKNLETVSKQLFGELDFKIASVQNKSIDELPKLSRRVQEIALTIALAHHDITIQQSLFGIDQVLCAFPLYKIYENRWGWIMQQEYLAKCDLAQPLPCMSDMDKESIQDNLEKCYVNDQVLPLHKLMIQICKCRAEAIAKDTKEFKVLEILDEHFNGSKDQINVIDKDTLDRMIPKEVMPIYKFWKTHSPTPRLWHSLLHPSTYTCGDELDKAGNWLAGVTEAIRQRLFAKCQGQHDEGNEAFYKDCIDTIEMNIEQSVKKLAVADDNDLTLPLFLYTVGLVCELRRARELLQLSVRVTKNPKNPSVLKVMKALDALYSERTKPAEALHELIDTWYAAKQIKVVKDSPFDTFFLRQLDFIEEIIAHKGPEFLTLTEQQLKAPEQVRQGDFLQNGTLAHSVVGYISKCIMQLLFFPAPTDNMKLKQQKATLKKELDEVLRIVQSEKIAYSASNTGRFKELVERYLIQSPSAKRPV